MWRLPFFEALGDAKRVLIAGAGGGFDVYAGLPLGLSLMNEGRTVYLGSLSIVNLYGLDKGVWLEPGVAAITADNGRLRLVGHGITALIIPDPCDCRAAKDWDVIARSARTCV